LVGEDSGETLSRLASLIETSDQLPRAPEDVPILRGEDRGIRVVTRWQRRGEGKAGVESIAHRLIIWYTGKLIARTTKAYTLFRVSLMMAPTRKATDARRARAVVKGCPM